MSRLTELIAQVARTDAVLADDLRREVEALSSRRPFGLNFERHVPESVQLPSRKIRRGDKVLFRSDDASDEPPWVVTGIVGKGRARKAQLVRRAQSEGHEEVTATLTDLVVVAEFRDPIYPGLRSTGVLKRGTDKPFHAVVNGENYHVLQALTFTCRGDVDCIYIDPPYNTRDKDWKYNNDYVDADDRYKHSKWLAMMERRLLLAKELLNPEDSTLIVTIDEKEYLRLGLLLQQTFPDAKMQMVSVAVNAKGTGRLNELRRVDEYVYFLRFGEGGIARIAIGEPPDDDQPSTEAVGLDWQTFRRRDLASRRGTRKGGPHQFYPIYVNVKTAKIEAVGEPLARDVSRTTAPKRRGCVAVFPVRPDETEAGLEMNWSLTRETFIERLERGFVKVGSYEPDKPQPYVLLYLKTGPISDIESGRATVIGRNPDGSVIATYEEERAKMPTTQWRSSSHSTEHYGTGLLSALIPRRTFPFPKSLYVVEDCLRLFLTDKPDALVVDFFAGSGTTAHAVMRLNRQDGGRRRSIMVTNNEVSADEAEKLRSQGHSAGDTNWETLGICEHITKPRIKAAIAGKTPSGSPIKGDYKFIDGFPMKEGFQENAEFFDLTYEDTERVRYGFGFESIAPLLWLRAGGEGSRIEEADGTFAVADTYAVLFDLDAVADFVASVRAESALRIAYIVTEDETQFQVVAGQLPKAIQPVRLYAAYLENFRIQAGA